MQKRPFITTALLLCSFLLHITAYAQTTVIRAGHLYDTRTGTFLNNRIIVVKDGKIQQVTAAQNYKGNDKIIDLSHSWVMPGLMDCHVHLTADYPYRNVRLEQFYPVESTALRALRGAYHAEQMLLNGFTTVKEIGNDANYATADVIRAIESGWAQGPTIIYAGKIIAPYGGQTYRVNPEHEQLWDFEYLDADSPDEIRKAIRKNIYHGATVIKLVSDEYPYYYDLADIKMAVAEARKAGMKLTVHVMGGEAARNVILGGADAIEHGWYLDDELLHLMKEKGTFLVGTDYTFGHLYAYAMDSTEAKSDATAVEDRLKRAYRIGVKMAFGTDVIVNVKGLNRIQSNLEVLKTWQAAKIPPSYILQTMTLHAAELLGVDKNRGTISPEYYADIIALKNNPLENIEAIKQVHFVMKEGKVIRHD